MTARIHSLRLIAGFVAIEALLFVLIAMLLMPLPAHADSVRCLPGFGPPEPGDVCGEIGDARNPMPDGYLALALSSNMVAGAGWAGAEDVAGRNAVSACTKSGGTGCKVAQSYHNSCASIAGSAPEKLIAVSVLKGPSWNASGLAMDKCRASGGHSCQLMVTACYNGVVSQNVYRAPAAGARGYEAPVLRRSRQ